MDKNENALSQFVSEYKGEVKRDEVLARYTTFKIGGPADVFVETHTKDEFTMAVSTARRLNLPITFLGGGTNILISDLGIRGIVIRNLASSVTMKGMKGTLSQGKSVRKVFVEADSGTSMNKLVRMTVEEGLRGLEMHLGLPGTVGGAIYMNSKWTNPLGYVGDCVYQATLINLAGNVHTESASYFRFGYDYSILQETHDCVVSVVFELVQDDKQVLWDIANRSIAYRRETQPQGVASPGCTFQNLSTAQAIEFHTPGLTQSAGYLLDHAGMKGKRVGNAAISDKHANFIVNLGQATASDVIELIRQGKQAVKAKFNVDLVEELVYLGDFEKTV